MSWHGVEQGSCQPVPRRGLFVVASRATRPVNPRAAPSDARGIALRALAFGPSGGNRLQVNPRADIRGRVFGTLFRAALDRIVESVPVMLHAMRHACSLFEKLSTMRRGTQAPFVFSARHGVIPSVQVNAGDAPRVQLSCVLLRAMRARCRRGVVHALCQFLVVSQNVALWRIVP